MKFPTSSEKNPNCHLINLEQGNEVTSCRKSEYFLLRVKMKKGAVVSLRAGARNIFDSSKPLLARFRRGDSASHVRVELITVNKRLSVVQY